jgi:hypothetical protein
MIPVGNDLPLTIVEEDLGIYLEIVTILVFAQAQPDDCD